MAFIFVYLLFKKKTLLKFCGGCFVVGFCVLCVCVCVWHKWIFFPEGGGGGGRKCVCVRVHVCLYSSSIFLILNLRSDLLKTIFIYFSFPKGKNCH